MEESVIIKATERLKQAALYKRFILRTYLGNGERDKTKLIT